MFGLFSKEKKELSLLLEVQSGLVRGALVAYSEDHPPRILFVTTHKIPTTPDINSTRIVKLMLNAVHEVVSHVAKEGLKRAGNLEINKRSLQTVHFILSSPWIVSESKTIKVSYEKNTEIKKEAVQKIVEDESAALSKKYEVMDAESVEQKIFEVRLNGYAVSHFEGREARELEVSFATSVSSAKFINRIRNEVQKILHIPRVHYHSCLLLQYNALRSLSNHKNEYIYAHVHDEFTDVIVVKNGLCIGLASIPFGVKTLIRKMSLSLKITTETSESLLTLLSEHKLEEGEEKKVRAVLEHIIQKWKLDFFKILTTASPPSLVPRTLYLSAHFHFELFHDIVMMENEFNFEIISYDDLSENTHFEFEKASEHSRMIEMYAYSLLNMVQ
ncbi:MAG: hypothetical protein V4697_02215 [Patescibacteria group bacterium]